MAHPAAYRIAPFPPEVAARARATRADAFGHRDLQPITADAPVGYPCRVCLRDAAVGEQLLLLSHQPGPQPHPHSGVGPVYVHAHDCQPWAEPRALPELLRSRLLAVRAYDAEGDLLDCELVQGREAEPVIARLFADPKAAALHLHFAKPGCFACRLERS